MDQPPRRNAGPGFSTRAIHLGYDPATEKGALIPPIFMTSTYALESAEAGAEMFRGAARTYDGIAQSWDDKDEAALAYLGDVFRK